MNDALAFLGSADRRSLKKGQMPRWTEPMLATLAAERFDHENWIYERKLDGERVLVFKHGRSVELYSRNHKNISDTYPEVVRQIQGQETAKCILDGEIVAFSGNTTSFSRLQKRMQITDRVRAGKSDVAVFLYVFDILYLDGYRTEGLALRRRKEILRRTMQFDGRLRFTSHRNEVGEWLYFEACRKGWEGIIAKDAHSAYIHGRSRKWLKFKCSRRQELVIGGWTDPGGDRKGFGALLIGFFRGEKLIYAGKVGTGYDEETLQRLHRELVSRERRASPFSGNVEKERNVHYCAPELVAEIEFSEWTDNGLLRHPRYLGLRRDKKASHVTREG